jgi:hypothetical protein
MEQAHRRASTVPLATAIVAVERARSPFRATSNTKCRI